MSAAAAAAPSASSPAAQASFWQRRLGSAALVLLVASALHLLLQSRHAPLSYLPKTLAYNVHRVSADVETRLSGLMAAVSRGFAQTVGNLSGAAGSGAAGADFDKIPKLESSQQLDEVLEGSSRIMVMVYADWCGHCKAMKPDYVKLHAAIAERYSEDQVRVFAYNGAKDCADKKCKIETLLNQVTGFPTLLLVSSKDKSIMKYEGARSARAMEDFIAESFLPLELSSNVSELYENLKQNRMSLVNYFPKSSSLSIDDAAKASAGIKRNLVYYVNDAALIGELISKTRDDKQNLFQNCDPDKIDLNKQQVFVFHYQNLRGKFPSSYFATDVAAVDASTLANMIHSDSFGKFSDREFMMSKLPQYFMLFRAGTSLLCEKSEKESCVNRSLDVLKQTVNQNDQLLGKLVILALDAESQDDQRIASILGISLQSIDCLVVFDTHRNTRFGQCCLEAKPLSQQISPADLTQFIQDAVQGTKKETVNSNLFAAAALTEKCADCQQLAVTLSTHDLNEFLAKHEHTLLYTYVTSKHGFDDAKTFANIPYQNLCTAVLDLTLVQEFDLADGKKISAENAPQVLLFNQQKLVDSYKGEISGKSLTPFLENNLPNVVCGVKNTVIADEEL